MWKPQSGPKSYRINCRQRRAFFSDRASTLSARRIVFLPAKILSLLHLLLSLCYPFFPLPLSILNEKERKKERKKEERNMRARMHGSTGYSVTVPLITNKAASYTHIHTHTHTHTHVHTERVVKEVDGYWLTDRDSRRGWGELGEWHGRRAWTATSAQREGPARPARAFITRRPIADYRQSDQAGNGIGYPHRLPHISTNQLADDQASLIWGFPILSSYGEKK